MLNPRDVPLPDEIMDAAEFREWRQGQLNLDQQRQHLRRAEKTIDALVRQTTTCDGTLTSAVRAWIREVNLAYEQVGDGGIIEVATRTITGSLRFEVERHISEVIRNNNVLRHAVPWALLRTHVRAQFLNVDEDAALRDDVEKTRQSPYEPEAQYSRRFRDVADAAYPAPRNVDQERILVKAFAKGLHSSDIARRLVEHFHPDTMEAAIAAVGQACERKDAYERLGRQEEPMEVAMMKNPAQKVIGLEAQMDQLAKQNERLNTKLAKMEADWRQQSTPPKDWRQQSAPPKDWKQQRNPPTRRPDEGNRRQRPDSALPRYDDQGRPRCFACGIYGHVAAQCGYNGQAPGNGPQS